MYTEETNVAFCSWCLVSWKRSSRRRGVKQASLSSPPSPVLWRGYWITGGYIVTELCLNCLKVRAPHWYLAEGLVCAVFLHKLPNTHIPCRVFSFPVPVPNTRSRRSKWLSRESKRRPRCFVAFGKNLLLFCKTLQWKPGSCCLATVFSQFCPHEKVLVCALYFNKFELTCHLNVLLMLGTL